MTPHLLPSNASGLERALATYGRTLPVPMRQIVDPAETPSDFLPFLAAHEGVRLWFDDWSDERKRAIVADWTRLARLIGTRAAAESFLSYVDGELIDRVSHPRRFVLGFSPIGVTPIGQQPFVSHMLVRVPVRRPSFAMVLGISAIGLTAFADVDDEPLRRARTALSVAKATETLVTADFGHRKPVTLDDGFPLDGSVRLGDFTDRKVL